jgi:hypothetical protein
MSALPITELNEGLYLLMPALPITELNEGPYLLMSALPITKLMRDCIYLCWLCSPSQGDRDQGPCGSLVPFI